MRRDDWRLRRHVEHHGYEADSFHEAQLEALLHVEVGPEAH